MEIGHTPKIGSTEKPCVLSTDPYLSAEYAKAENEKLWPKVWQMACRVEEIPRPGDFYTYDIMDESIIVVRTEDDTIAAYFNVCQHRGRRLTEGCGRTKRFFCRFHGWAWNLKGENTHVQDPEDWGEALTPENIALPAVKVDTWGGWVWINMDAECEPLSEFLAPASDFLAPFELEKMRYKWRKWLYFPCNWKTAVEAFNESYHVETSHPQLSRWVRATYWSKGEGKHSHHGVAAPRDGGMNTGSSFNSVRAQEGADPRIAVAELMHEIEQTLNATITQTLIDTADRLVDELPAGSGSAEVGGHLMASATRTDAERGVVWPTVTHEQIEAAGADWHVFPNAIILPGLIFALGYRARPHDMDPNSCIFEAYALERYPEGEEPETAWEFTPDPADESWRKILGQDFSNMPEVQKGMKSRGFIGARPSPLQEVCVTHFHRVLAEYMGTDAPQEI